MRNPWYKVLGLTVLATVVTAAAAAQSIVTTISFPYSTLGIVANFVTNKAYVVSPTFDGVADGLGVIDGKTNTLQQTISIPSGSSSVALDELTNRIFVAGCNQNVTPVSCTVTVINGRNNSVIATLPITSTAGFGLTGIAVNDLDGRVYVANGSDNVVNIIDGYRLRSIGTIDLHGNSPAAIAINPILNRLYVPYGASEIAIVDGRSRRIVNTVTFGATPAGAAVNVFTGDVFVSDSTRPSSVGVFGANGVQKATVPVAPSPLGLAVDLVTNKVFVSSTGRDTVSVIDGSTDTVLSKLGGVPSSYLAVNPVTGKVYVSGRTGVTVLNEQ
jgi:DNA-binding beta-propeller fold protein YncE